MRNIFFAKKKICSTFYFFHILEQENTEPVVEAQNPEPIPEQSKKLTEGQPDSNPPTKVNETITEPSILIEENQEAEKVLDAVEESKKVEENVENAIVEPLENSDKETEETIATNDVTEGIEDKKQAIAEKVPEVVPETAEQSLDLPENKVEPLGDLKAEPQPQPQVEPQVEPQTELQPQVEPQPQQQRESQPEPQVEHQPEPVEEIPIQNVESTTETEPSSFEKPNKIQGSKSKQC